MRSECFCWVKIVRSASDNHVMVGPKEPKGPQRWPPGTSASKSDSKTQFGEWSLALGNDGSLSDSSTRVEVAQFCGNREEAEAWRASGEGQAWAKGSMNDFLVVFWPNGMPPESPAS